MASVDYKDISYEEDILRDPNNIKNWWYYLEFKTDAPAEVRNLIYERALRKLPRSYKLWMKYLTERVTAVKDLCATDIAVTKVNNCFERSLVHMNKMPLVWKKYLEFLMKQKHNVTKTRHTFDNALRALPVTQHLRWVWPLYLTFAKESGVPETAMRVWRRYLKVEPTDKEDFIKFLKKVGRLDQAAVQLAELVNDDNFTSNKGKSKHDLWTELLNMIVKNPAKITSLNVEAIIRGGIRRYSHEVGHLWTSLADFNIRLGHFEKARDVYEEGVNTVSTVRDFTLIFDAYTQYEESMLAAKMEALEDAKEEDVDDNDVDLRMLRLENLMKRQPILLSSVLLRQNPHNVSEWHKRVLIFTEGDNANPARAIQTYTDAVTTVDPQKATGKPHTLWVSFAKFYERHGDLKNARVIFQSATKVNYKNVDDLAHLWCEYAELELRHNNYDNTRKILKDATHAPKHEVRKFGSKAKVPVQKLLYKSTKVWSMYADIEETLGTRETTKAVYEKMLDLKVATPIIVLNYAKYLEELKYFEDSFRVYEKGVALFSYPHVAPIWLAYLRQFITRYQGQKIERTRDLFEQAVADAPAKEGENLYLLYSKFEEDYGGLSRAMRVYDRLCEKCTLENKLKLFTIYLNKCGDYYGATATREIFEKALKSLSEKDVKPIVVRYASLEKKLGEIDRARALYVYGSQFADPKTSVDYWRSWHEFEVQHGNTDTFKEMSRVRRTVTAQFGQESMMSIKIDEPEKPVAALSAKRKEPTSSMEAIEQQKPPPAAAPAPVTSSTSSAKTSNPDEIDFEMDDGEGDVGGGITQKAVPAAVFGAADGDKPMGAKERFAARKA
mmetsp:Transcript_16854/g.32896  ORF Transcript_16854/g.32896 Transcript_16854/m.32896 type:complete len:838 (+) Transcript_16854:31-2544(+)|eukprot:CAMPEP_0175140926 /NCGR_PEP_ID=MMETSP0087-20121206/11794_1 /TAXON_ID=136419 /ORGANISM="Unknown Unknown, Strain D1" /LENGTH=837 /DNA_ID=CAMNT_0016424231 /DNA_START=16 /DNA_END=2529 /DNA_ORIENTATION=+